MVVVLPAAKIHIGINFMGPGRIIFGPGFSFDRRRKHDSEPLASYNETKPQWPAVYVSANFLKERNDEETTTGSSDSCRGCRRLLCNGDILGRVRKGISGPRPERDCADSDDIRQRHLSHDGLEVGLGQGHHGPHATAQGQNRRILFADCLPKWDKLSDDEKDATLTKAIAPK